MSEYRPQLGRVSVSKCSCVQLGFFLNQRVIDRDNSFPSIGENQQFRYMPCLWQNY